MSFFSPFHSSLTLSHPSSTFSVSFISSPTLSYLIPHPIPSFIHFLTLFHVISFYTVLCQSSSYSIFHPLSHSVSLLLLLHYPTSSLTSLHPNLTLFIPFSSHVSYLTIFHPFHSHSPTVSSPFYPSLHFLTISPRFYNAPACITRFFRLQFHFLNWKQCLNFLFLFVFIHIVFTTVY